MNSHVVFNIAGNEHRLIVGIDYPRGIVVVRFLGTHREYESVDADRVEPGS